MDLHLSNKVFIVTGGAQGIGEGIARTIHDEKGIVIIIDKNEKRGKELITELEDHAHFLYADLSLAEECQRAVNKAIDLYGRIDGLVNNIGINDSVSLEQGGPEAFVASVSKNLFHYYFMAHYALPMLKKSRGTILNIASKTAVTGQGGTSGYTAAKGGQLAMTRDWAIELLPYHIRVNAILPAEVMTPMYQQWLSTFPDQKEKLKEIEKRIPLGNRMTTAKEIGDMAAFLLSDRASHITGQHIYVDGGYVHLDRALAGN